MMCTLFNIEMPIGKQCPSSFRLDGHTHNRAPCFIGCVWSDDDGDD